MSVRHVHARPGEYIAVHRHGRPASDSERWLYGIGIIGAIVFVCMFWQIILTCLIGAGVVWLIWVFRRPLGRAIGRNGRKLWRRTLRFRQEIRRQFSKTETGS